MYTSKTRLDAPESGGGGGGRKKSCWGRCQGALQVVPWR